MPVAVFIFQQLQICWWKHEAFERFEKQNTITLHVKPHQLNWEKKNKEVIIDGSLFDVKDIEITSDGDYLLTGIFDRHEDLLKKTFTENLASQSSKKSQAACIFFSFLYCENIRGENQLNILYNERPVFTEYINAFISHYMGDIFIPPPNC